MKFTVDYRKKGFADGVYKVTASGYDKAILSWANKTSALEDWICFASFALDKNGNGVFEFRGGRGIPEEASHIEVKLLRYENNIEENTISIPLNEQYNIDIYVIGSKDGKLSKKSNAINVKK